MKHSLSAASPCATASAAVSSSSVFTCNRRRHGVAWAQQCPRGDPAAAPAWQPAGVWWLPPSGPKGGGTAEKQQRREGSAQPPGHSRLPAWISPAWQTGGRCPRRRQRCGPSPWPCPRSPCTAEQAGEEKGEGRRGRGGRGGWVGWVGWLGRHCGPPCWPGPAESLQGGAGRGEGRGVRARLGGRKVEVGGWVDAVDRFNQVTSPTQFSRGMRAALGRKPVVPASSAGGRGQGDSGCGGITAPPTAAGSPSWRGHQQRAWLTSLR